MNATTPGAVRAGDTDPATDPQASPLVRRLVADKGARWVHSGNHDHFVAGAGDHVLFFSGDAVRFPESLDVAVVLPELQSALALARAGGAPFAVGAVVRRDEDAIARRWGVQRWPSLVFLRDGRYVGELAGMHDWDDYVRQVAALLHRRPGRAPTVGIPVVAAVAARGGC
jgi:hydrogenase-1 operon protein HyaE